MGSFLLEGARRRAGGALPRCMAVALAAVFSGCGLNAGNSQGAAPGAATPIATTPGGGQATPPVHAVPPAPSPPPDPAPVIPPPPPVTTPPPPVAPPPAHGLDWVTVSSETTTPHGFSMWPRLAAFSDGSCVVAGEYMGPVTFGATTLPSPADTGAAGNQALVRYKPDGSVDWAKAAVGGTDSHVSVDDVATFSDGTCVVVGTLYGTAPSPQGPGTAIFGSGVSLSGQGIYVARYGSTGDCLGATLYAVGDTLTMVVAGVTTPVFVVDAGHIFVQVCTFADGSFSVSGQFNGTATFGAFSVSRPYGGVSGPPVQDMFVAHFGADGTPAWVTQGGGTAAGNALVWPDALAACSDGSCIVTGQYSVGSDYSGSFAFGSATLTAPAAGAADGWIAKLSATGSSLWAKRTTIVTPTLPGGSSYCWPRAVSTLADGGFVLSGGFMGSEVTFGIGEAHETTLAYASGPAHIDTFVSKHNADGTLAWATSAPASPLSFPNGIAAFPDGSAVIAGSFYSSVSFGPDHTETGVGAFFARIGSDGTFLWSKSHGGSGCGVAALAEGAFLFLGTNPYGAVTTLGAGEPHETTLPVSSSTEVFVAKYFDY